MSDEASKFAKVFRAELSPGKRYYKRLPLSPSIPYYDRGILDLQTHEETGVKLEMAESDFERLMIAASEGLSHQRFREMHPAAQEAYEQYWNLYLLTKQHDNK